MADGTSYITTASEQANELYKSNRDYNNQLTWSSMLNSNDRAAAQAQTQLLNSYNQASAEAYASSLQNKQALQNSTLVGNYQKEALSAYDAQLKSDRADIQSSYYENQNSIESARSENETAITDALNEQAEYTAEYTNAHYDYLQYLYEDYQNGNNTLFNSALYSKYLGYDYQRDDEGNILKDEEGNYLYDTDSPYLKSWDQLAQTSTDENGEYTSIYDENGNLTSFGIDFFDQMENSWDYVSNADYNNNSSTWTSWLRENNEDLYNWAGSYNYYNYTEAGTNAGTVRTQYGMMSTDMTYSYLERFGGMTTSQVDSYFGKVSDAINVYNEAVETANDSGKGKDRDKALDAAKTAIDAMDDIINGLNLGSSFEAEGYNWESVKSKMLDYVDMNSKSYKSRSAGMIGTALAGVAGATVAAGFAVGAVAAESAIIAGASMGAFSIALGISATGIGLPIGCAIAICTAIVGGVLGAYYQGKAAAETFEKQTTGLNDLFSQFAVMLTDYKTSMSKKVNQTRNAVIY